MRFACQNVLAHQTSRGSQSLMCEARTTSVNIRLNARECYEPRLRASYITKSTSLVCEPHFQSSHTDLARQGWIQGSNARQILIIILSSMRGSHSYEASGLRGSHIPGMRGSHSYEASGLRGSPFQACELKIRSRTTPLQSARSKRILQSRRRRSKMRRSTWHAGNYAAHEPKEMRQSLRSPI